MEKLNSQIVIYKDKNGNIKIDVRFDSDTVWLTQAHMAVLFQKDRKTITEHIQNIFNEDELIEDSVCRKFQHTAADIRSSEKRFYRKITDIYATSVDYDPTNDQSLLFFKTVQNKVHI